MVELGARGVARLVAREQPDRRVERLVPAQREEGDAHGGIGDRDAVRRGAGRRKAGILDVADDHAGLDVRRA